MANRINMIEGSSVDPEIIERVRTMAGGYRRIRGCLDSNHTHAQVLAELEAYAPLVTPGSDCVVFDRAL
jgi:cephalosporin hydroxylase